MALQDETEVRKTDSLNGFLRRWRRNASQAGVLSAILMTLVAALAVFALCACQSIIRSGRSFP